MDNGYSLRKKVWKQIVEQDIKCNHKVKCSDCGREACRIFGGLRGELMFCNECHSASFCEKEIKHSIKCCLNGFTEIKSVKKPLKFSTETERKLVKYLSKKKRKAYQTLFGSKTFKEASNWLKEKSDG